MTTSKACARYLVNIAQPFTDVLKALGVGDVIDQHDAHGSSVVGGGDGVEPLLARRVPAETVTLSHSGRRLCPRGQMCKCRHLHELSGRTEQYRH